MLLCGRLRAGLQGCIMATAACRVPCAGAACVAHATHTHTHAPAPTPAQLPTASGLCGVAIVTAGGYLLSRASTHEPAASCELPVHGGAPKEALPNGRLCAPGRGSGSAGAVRASAVCCCVARRQHMRQPACPQCHAPA